MAFGILESIKPVEPPKTMIDSFKRVDDRLDVKFIQYPFSDGSNINSIKYWAVILKWPENDKRRIAIQRGEMSASQRSPALWFQESRRCADVNISNWG